MRYLAVALAHAGDLATFLMGVAVLGIEAEANPIMRAAYSAMPLLAVALKGLGVAVMCLVIYGLWGRWRAAGTAIAVGGGLAGMVVNAAAVTL